MRESVAGCGCQRQWRAVLVPWALSRRHRGGLRLRRRGQSNLDDHLTLWGIEPVGATYTASIGPDGAGIIVEVVIAIHRLAMAVDSEAARWV